MNLCDKTQELISGYIDHELNQQDRQRVRVHIESCDQCRAVYDDLLAIKQEMGNLQYPECEEAQLDKIMKEPVANGMAIVGWIILIIGFVGFMVWQLFTFYTEPSVPFWVKAGVFLIEAGVLLLLGSVLRQRMIALKTDKYKNVKF
ncbi:MAG: zf-HC2 domain-containing protein [Kangiella sp.]|jgi:predicted anti-sigma-YlaC factor YlaD|nr:zf-HC2 domain-containing protein [Kangiella sp.]